MPTKLSVKTIVFAGVATIAGLALNIGLTSEAYARIKGPALDSFSAGCLALQNESDSLVAEYKNATDARREEILAQLRNISRTWIEIGCKAVFGDISLLVLTPHGLRNGITLDRLVAPPADQDTHPSPAPDKGSTEGNGQNSDGISFY